MKLIHWFGLLAAVCLFTAGAMAQNPPDKAALQKIWDGWSTMNPANVDQYYAHGAHVFFDDEPLKYDTWEDYRKTTAEEFEKYKSARFTLNPDLQIHQVTPSFCWGTATVSSDEVQKDGKEEKGTLRWTFVMEKQNGKWRIVHEHVSVPAS